MMAAVTGIWTFAVVVVMVLLAGCASHSPETSFYQLVPLSELGQENGKVEAEGFSVGIGPITVPDYLKRPQIVTRRDSSQLIVEEFHRWASPIERDIASVMVDNLTTLLGNQRIVTFPWDRFAKPDYRVVYDIQRFDGILGEKAILSVRWTVFDTVAKKADEVHRSSYEQPVAGAAYRDLVQAQSEILSELSRDIAEELVRVSKQKQGS